jgi:hypothetical protein
MKIEHCKQRSAEWYRLKVGSIGGTRFGQVISGRKNRLVYDLANERLSGYADEDGYVNDDMQFGIDTEPVAAQLYEERTGIKFEEVGMIRSEASAIHHASPDRINFDRGIILEIKCTQDGAIHMQRYFEGVEAAHYPQIKNYFAISDEVKQVHWVSYCPFRPERPLVVHIFNAEDFVSETIKARDEIKKIEIKVQELIEKFTF